MTAAHVLSDQGARLPDPRLSRFTHVLGHLLTSCLALLVLAAAGMAQTFDPDAYYRVSNKASTDPAARLWQQASGAQDGAHMWPEHKGQERSFHWQIQSLGANEYEIINRVSGQALVRRNQWEVHVATDRSARTVWRIEPDGNSGYFRIINDEVNWGLVMAKGGNDWDVHLDDAAANHDRFRWKLERVTERFPLIIRNGGVEVVSFEIVPGQNFESSSASGKHVANPEVKVILDRRPGSGGAMAHFAIKPLGRRFRGETIPCRFTGDGRIAIDTSGSKHIRGSLGASNPDGSYVWTFTLPTIQAPSSFAVGEKVKVGYPALRGSNNMIALAKKGTPDTGPDGRKQMTFLGNSSSSVEFGGLTEEGDYEARLFIDFDSSQPTVDARVAFQVVAWPKLTVEESYKQGQPVIVKFDKLLDVGRDLIWLASGGKMMARKFARIDADGAKAVVFVGGDDLPAGDYEARYQSAAYNKTVATSKPFKITAVTAAAPAAATIPMVFTVADTEFSYGDSVVISYANLPPPPKGGYHRMLVFKNGGKDPVQERLVALDKTSVKLIDLAKGHYDVHLIPAGDTKPAKTLSFDVVVPPSLTVSRHDYDQGAQIVVHFHDLPGAKGEEIKLFRKHDRDDARHQGQVLTQWRDSGTVNNGVVTFKNLILDPGTYEARYFSSTSSKAIASCEFTVVKAKK